MLLHLGSLDAALGRGGRAFIDWLAQAGFSVWQFLPPGPVGADGSPYWVRSDSAGNPAFLDPAEIPQSDTDEYREFLSASNGWLEDYALFEAIGAAPHEVLFVGDSLERDVLPAKKLGMSTCLVGNRVAAPVADFHVQSIAELAK